MSFVEISVTPNQVRTGEIFTLFAILMNNSTEVVQGRIAHVITNRSYTVGWHPPRIVSISRVSSSGVSYSNRSFGPIKPGEYLNCTIVLRPREPGKFLIYLEVTLNTGEVLRSNRLEVKAYGESIIEEPLPFPIWKVVILVIIFSLALALVLWFKPTLRAKVISGIKGLREKSSYTASTLLVISLILASPYIVQSFLSPVQNPNIFSIFLSTYSYLLFLGLPAFTILHGLSTEMPARSFLVAFVPIIAETLISNLTRPYPFVPFYMVVFKFYISLILGLIGAGAALAKKRKKSGYILLALGLILWITHLIGGFLQI